MARFYFDVRSDGMLIRDEMGIELRDHNEARSRALETIPALLQDVLHRTNVCVTMEVRDSKQTLYVIRATIEVDVRVNQTT